MGNCHGMTDDIRQNLKDDIGQIAKQYRTPERLDAEKAKAKKMQHKREMDEQVQKKQAALKTAQDALNKAFVSQSQAQGGVNTAQTALRAVINGQIKRAEDDIKGGTGQV